MFWCKLWFMTIKTKYNNRKSAISRKMFCRFYQYFVFNSFISRWKYNIYSKSMIDWRFSCLSKILKKTLYSKVKFIDSFYFIHTSGYTSSFLRIYISEKMKKIPLDAVQSKWIIYETRNLNYYSNCRNNDICFLRHSFSKNNII